MTDRIWKFPVPGIAASDVSGLSDAATTSVDDIIAAAVAHINTNYGGLLDAAALCVTKGDMLVFAGSAWSFLSVSANDGKQLTEDSAEPTGMGWQAA